MITLKKGTKIEVDNDDGIDVNVKGVAAHLIEGMTVNNDDKTVHLVKGTVATMVIDETDETDEMLCLIDGCKLPVCIPLSQCKLVN